MDVTFRVSTATVRDAMEVIQEGRARVAFALSDDGRLVGVITDGDIRRALLNGAVLTDPVAPLIRANPVVAHERESRASVLDLMRARRVPQVPIVNDGNEMVGLHLMHDFLDYRSRSNIAFILAGGKGTRLLPLTANQPKPMIKVAGRPILERIVNHLVGHGIRRIFISVGYMAAMIEDHFEDGARYGCTIEYVREHSEQPLGTAGPLARVRTELQRVGLPILVLNGDLVTDFDVSNLLESHARSEAAMTIGTYPYTFEIPFGVISQNDTDQVVSISEKPMRQELVSAGLYVLEPHVLDLVPDDQPYPMNELIESVIKREFLVSSCTFSGDWTDVGLPADLARAQGSS